MKFQQIKNCVLAYKHFSVDVSVIIIIIVIVFIIANALYALIPKILIAFSGFHESSVAFFTCFHSGVHRYLSQVILIVVIITIVSFAII